MRAASPYGCAELGLDSGLGPVAGLELVLLPSCFFLPSTLCCCCVPYSTLADTTCNILLITGRGLEGDLLLGRREFLLLRLTQVD